MKIYKELNQKQFKQFYQHLNKNTNFLEVGCSFGVVTTQVDRIGVNQCHAIEPNKADAVFVSNALDNATIDNSLLEDTEFQHDNYDIVVSFEVMEHVVSPYNFIEKRSK